MKCTLEIVSGIYDGLLFECDYFPIKIGRDPNECEIAIPYDDAASRKHAELTHENNTIYIDDLKSTNSTFVNDAKIGEGLGKRNLNDGDVIRVGETYIQFNM